MTITLVGNKSGVYIDPRTCNACVDFTKATNYDDVKFLGVNHLVIRRNDDGSLKIVQAGGYTVRRGMFVDLY